MENANIPPPIQEPDNRLIDSYHMYDIQEDAFDKGELYSNFNGLTLSIRCTLLAKKVLTYIANISII